MDRGRRGRALPHRSRRNQAFRAAYRTLRLEPNGYPQPPGDSRELEVDYPAYPRPGIRQGLRLLNHVYDRYGIRDMQLGLRRIRERRFGVPQVPQEAIRLEPVPVFQNPRPNYLQEIDPNAPIRRLDRAAGFIPRAGRFLASLGRGLYREGQRALELMTPELLAMTAIGMAGQLPSLALPAAKVASFVPATPGALLTPVLQEKARLLANRYVTSMPESFSTYEDALQAAVDVLFSKYGEVASHIGHKPDHLSKDRDLPPPDDPSSQAF